MAYSFKEFSGTPSGFRVFLRRHARLMGAVLAFGFITLGGIAPAGSCTDYEPIDITVEQPEIIPGQTLPVRVELSSAGSAAVTIYSDPPGAVSYQGTIQSGNTVLAATSSSLSPSSTVTVYAITDGRSVALAQATVKQSSALPYQAP